jgi:hypothetical protein
MAWSYAAAWPPFAPPLTATPVKRSFCPVSVWLSFPSLRTMFQRAAVPACRPRSGFASASSTNDPVAVCGGSLAAETEVSVRQIEEKIQGKASRGIIGEIIKSIRSPPQKPL